MKNNLLQIFLIIVIHLAAISLLFKPGLYLSHDGPVQVARLGAYYKALTDFSIPPRWAGDLNYRYGTPVFNFYYPLPGYLGSFLHIIGFSLQNSFKIISGLSFILAPVFFFIWIKKFFTPWISFSAALFYGLAPYHFLNLYIRGDIGELVGFIFLPLVFWSIENINEKPERITAVLGSVFYALLILSHNGLSLIFSPIFVVYALLRNRTDKKRLINAGIVIFLGLGISAYFWIPAIYDARFVNFLFFSNNLYRDNFPNVGQLIYSAWGFGPEVSKIGGLSPQIGPVHIFLTITAFLLIIFKKIKRKQASFWMLVFGIAFFLSLNVSEPVWRMLKLLRQLEFPWRLTAITSFASAVLAGFVFKKLNNKFINTICVAILLISGSALIKTDKPINYRDQYYLTYPGTTTFHGEVSTIWSGSDQSNFPGKSLEVIAGDAQIIWLTKTTARHQFSVQSQLTSRILDNTLYFPGWTVKVDGLSVPIQFQDPNHKGLISFLIPPGKHTVEVLFTETSVRLAADMISLVSFSAVALELLIGLNSKAWKKNIS